MEVQKSGLLLQNFNHGKNENTMINKKWTWLSAWLSPGVMVVLDSIKPCKIMSETATYFIKN